MDAWIDEQPKTSEITLKVLQDLCNSFLSLKDEAKTLDKQARELEIRAAEIENRILQIYEDNNIQNMQGAWGTLSKVNRETYTQPQTLEDKLALFEYLKNTGKFDALVSVNSRTLSSWASEEVKNQDQQGNFGWLPPGIKAPYTKVSLRLMPTRGAKK
jgi:hypothetical protein